MKALVTGASGHIGANLVRSLSARNHEVRALVHQDTRAVDGLNVEQVRGNILDPESLQQACNGIDIVFHLAARISLVKDDRQQVEAMNITGVRNIVEACLSAGVKRLIHTSSFHSRLQEPLDELFDEDRPLVSGGRHPHYNTSKAEGERIVTGAISRGLDAVIVIPSGVIGPNDWQPSHFGQTLLNIAERRLRVLVDAGLDWVDARDVADAMITASEKAPTGSKYLLSGNRATLRELSLLIADFMGHKPPRIILPLAAGKLAAPIASTLTGLRNKRRLFTPTSIKELDSNRNLCCDRARQELGYDPRPLKTTIYDTLEWFREHGYLTVKKRIRT